MPKKYRFTYDELSSEGQKRAREWWLRASECDNHWSEWVIEEWQEKLEALGFIDPDIRFSGFWSQGDGASFTCERIERKFSLPRPLRRKLVLARTTELCRRRLNGETVEKRDLSYLVTIRPFVERDTDRYVHEYTVDVNMDANEGSDLRGELDKEVDAWIEETRLALREEVRTLSRQIYRELESAYNDYFSHDNAAESIRANDYEFDEDGDLLPERPRRAAA